MRLIFLFVIFMLLSGCVQEETTTTTEPTTTTTTTTTTSTSTTTTTTLPVECNNDTDCGSNITYRCSDDKTVIKEVTQYMCENPGTPAAKCVPEKTETLETTKCTGWDKCIPGTPYCKAIGKTWEEGLKCQNRYFESTPEKRGVGGQGCVMLKAGETQKTNNSYELKLNYQFSEPYHGASIHVQEPNGTEHELIMRAGYTPQKIGEIELYLKYIFAKDSEAQVCLKTPELEDCMPEGYQPLDGVVDTGYHASYEDYRFKIDRPIYINPVVNVRYEFGYVLDVEKPDGEVSSIYVKPDRFGTKIDDLEIHVCFIEEICTPRFYLNKTMPEIVDCASKTGDEKDQCYLNQALRTENISMCGKVMKASIRDDCIFALRGNDSKQCANIHDEDKRFQCYTQNAVKTRDGTLCAEITDSDIRDDCYLQAATVVNDPKLCSQIKEREIKDRCYYYVACKLNDSGLCHRIVGSYQDTCYIKVAVSLEDTEVCEKIQDRTTVSRCFREIAAKTGDRSICNKISESDATTWCFALVDKDADLCREIDSEVEVDSCYGDVAEALQDRTICIKIKDEYYEDLCFYDVAVASGDRTTCNKIGDWDMRRNCLNVVR